MHFPLLQGGYNFCKSDRLPPDHVVSPWNEASSSMDSPSFTEPDSDEAYIPYYSDRYVCSGSATAPAVLLLALSLLTTLTAAADGRGLLASVFAHSGAVSAGARALKVLLANAFNVLVALLSKINWLGTSLTAAVKYFNRSGEILRLCVTISIRLLMLMMKVVYVFTRESRIGGYCCKPMTSSFNKNEVRMCR